MGLDVTLFGHSFVGRLPCRLLQSSVSCDKVFEGGMQIAAPGRRLTNKHASLHVEHLTPGNRVIIVLGICDVLSETKPHAIFNGFMDLTSELTRRHRTDYCVLSIPKVPRILLRASDDRATRKRKRAKQRTVDDVNQLLQRNYGDRFQNFEPCIEMYTSDGLHLNDNGNIYLAGVVDNCIAKQSYRTSFRALPSKHCLFFDGSKVFSNFYPFALQYNGQMYHTSEHLYQCLKLEGLVTEKDLEHIRSAPTPQACKVRAHAVRCDKGLLEHRKEDAMRVTLRVKFAQCHAFRTRLMHCTGVIVETSPYDLYWGCGIDFRSPLVSSLVAGRYPGSNRLGHLLMELRTEMVQEGVFKK